MVAQIGARRHYAVPRALVATDMLDCLHTDACADLAPWRWIKKWPGSFRTDAIQHVLDRHVNGVPAKSIRCDLGFVLLNRFGPQRRRPGESNIQHWLRQNRLFCERCVRRGFGTANSVYVYNGAGLEILQSARRGGLFSVVDQTSAAMRWDAKLLMEEAERWPDWATPEDSVEGWEEMSKREEEEWQLADRIICGSRYVADTIKAVGGPVEKCRVVPYGYGEEKDKSGNLKPEKDKNQKAESLNDCVSAPASGFRSHPSSLSARPLRVLFVGTLCLRKGIPYLCEVMGLLKDDKIQFRIVGPSHTTEQGVSSLRQFAEVVGSIPRSALAEHYEWADVLVLPSLSEGSANVCHEAASHGIPMIITPNAGFALENGMAGSIVPIRSPTAIAEALRKTTIRARPPRSATVTQLDDSAQAFVNALA